MDNCIEIFKEIENGIKSLPTNFQPKMIGEGPVYDNPEIQKIIDKIDDCIENADFTNHQQCVLKLKELKGRLEVFGRPLTPMEQRPIILNKMEEVIEWIEQNCF